MDLFSHLYLKLFKLEISGQGRSDDLNGYNPSGVSRLDAARYKGKRWRQLTHILPQKKKNLDIITGTRVTKVNLNQ